MKPVVSHHFWRGVYVALLIEAGAVLAILGAVYLLL
jgi:hypothetical protein